MSRFFLAGESMTGATRTHHGEPRLTAADWVTDIILVDDEPDLPARSWSEVLAEAAPDPLFSGPDSLMAFLADLDD